MSGKLIALNEIHNFNDDLESTLYIMLWVALMFLECSDSTKVAGFVAIVLDPQLKDHITPTYTGKPDFLIGRAFLEQVKFPQRHHLNILLCNLAMLFLVRYEKAPTEKKIKETQWDFPIRCWPRNTGFCACFYLPTMTWWSMQPQGYYQVLR